MMHRLKRTADPRDKVYAMVGLTRAAEDPSYVIDYQLSPRDVFVNTVDYVLRRTGSLDMILVHTRDFTNFEMPTWVLDFGMSGTFGPIPFRHACLHSAYRASATRRAEAGITREQGVLTARGICFASIDTLAPPITSYNMGAWEGGIMVRS
jgi:hypothetical protein